MTKRSINLIQFWLTVAFFLLPGMSFGTATYLRFGTRWFGRTEVDARSYLLFVLLVTVLWAFIIEHLGLNRISKLITLRTGVATAARASTYCAAMALSVCFFYRAITFARIFVVVGCVLLFLLSICMVHLARGILHAADRFTNGRFPIAILGADQFANRVADHLSKNALARCKIACFVSLPGQVPTTSTSPVVDWENLQDIVDVYHCSEVLICLPPDWIGKVRTILEEIQHLCIPGRVVLDLGEGVFFPERIFDYCGIPLLDVRPYAIDTIGYVLGKRVFDITFSLFTLLFTAPIFLVIALAVKFSSSGPVFFVQERVSLNGRRFKMLKFRSMYLHDARISTETHTHRTDSRITPVGRFLRRSSLDELPQFLNVLTGDMSVVGPRPELTYFVQKFRQEIPSYMARHNVKCGITGWAQVNGLRGSDTSIAERIEYDLYYLRNWNMALDVRIIFMTVFRGLLSPHAY